MLGDLIDGADWIVMQGVVDKKRLGISGASYKRRPSFLNSRLSLRAKSKANIRLAC
jgi:hypothetical protein